MARSTFPAGDFGRGVSQGLVGGAVGAPGAGGAAAIAEAAQGFGQRVRKMAETAWTREGEADAARMIGLEKDFGVTAALRPGQGVDDQAYNAALRGQHLADRQAAYVEELGKIEIANPDSEVAFGRAHEGMVAAFAPTGDAETDLAFGRFRTLQDVQALGRVRGAQEEKRQQTVRGAYLSTSATAGTALGQAIASAGFDTAGAQLVGQSLTQFAQGLAQYGPREAFSVGGVDFPADPTRAGVVSVEKLASDFNAAQAQARMAWLSAAMDRAPTAAAKAAFLGQVQERWQSGDAMFAGLDAQDFGQLTNRLDAEVSRARTGESAAQTQMAERTRQLLKAGEYGDDVDPGELRAAAAASGDPGLIAQVDFALQNGFEATPASLRAAATASGVASIGDTADFIIDVLEGSGFIADDNGRGRSQYGITEKSHPAEWAGRTQMDRGVARGVIQRDYVQPFAHLSPAMRTVASAAATVGGVQTAQRLLAQAGDDPERFLQLEEARFRRLASENPDRYGRFLPGWLRRQGQVRGYLQQQSARVRALEGFSSDPIGFARGNGRRAALAPIAEYDPNAVFNGDVAGWGDWLRSRRATGQQLAREWKGIPPAILSDDEEAFYKARFQSDPASIMTFTTAAAQALGEDGARELLGQLGRNPGQASADLHMASLALDAGARSFAALATEGRRLMAEGAPAPRFETGEGLEDAQRGVAGAYRTMPDLAGPVLATARAAAAADAARGQQRPADHYVQSALGRNPYNGKFYGGAVDVNGAQTLLPSWVRQDAMDEVLTWVSRAAVAGNWGPVFDNGQPIPVSGLARMQLQAQPDGQYRLINPRTGRPVPNRQGRPWEFDIDTDERHAALRRVMPDLIRPRR
ncbi:hypothetical protein SH203_02837 [Brevundimonas sp. SH203]|uniref:hypothetical protein n=1 Tax=Brevundimonas sp. SH203 TaxID=345167 RepID=UPI0009D11297|nr:hypothetical protein [Brevundimonas sp. SH203]GAW42421.1 hypothetical protein SH203_02837 [Brevundimonas sp. SH203]